MRRRWGSVLRYLAGAAAASLFLVGARFLLGLLPTPVAYWLWISGAYADAHRPLWMGLLRVLGRVLLSSAAVFVVFAVLFAPVHWAVLKVGRFALAACMAAGAGLVFVASSLTPHGPYGWPMEWYIEWRSACLAAVLGAGMGAVFWAVAGQLACGWVRFDRDASGPEKRAERRKATLSCRWARPLAGAGHRQAAKGPLIGSKLPAGSDPKRKFAASSFGLCAPPTDNRLPPPHGATP